MKTKSIFTDAGWDFENVWDIDGVTNAGYPFLKPDTTGIDDEIIIPNENECSVYPNPASDVLNISITNVDKVQIFDVVGHLMLEASSTCIDISTLSRGYYLVIIKSNNKIWKEQFIKK